MPLLSYSEIMDLGISAHRNGRLAEAEHYYRQLLVQQPKNHRLLHLFGLVHHQTQRQTAALDFINQALDLAPQEPEYYNSRGEVRREQGSWLEARADYEKALSLRPDYAEALTNLGSYWQQQNCLPEAERLHYRAHALAPDSPIILNNLGTVLDRTQRRTEAWQCYREAIEKDPRYLRPRINLISSLLSAQKHRAAQEEADKASTLFPLSYELWLWQARACKENDRPHQAQQILEKHRGEFRELTIEALMLLATCHHGVGEIDQSLAIYAEILALNPEHYHSAYNQVTLLNYAQGDDAERLFQVHCQFTEQFYPTPTTPPRPYARRSTRLRLGYLSNDFLNHSIARFILPVFERHDSKRFEVHGFSLNNHEDTSTHRYQRAAHFWHKCAETTDEELETLIRQSQIDVLIDLGGLFGARLGLLNRQPAPVQVCFLGYPNTCGLKTVQYRITDAVADPVGLTERYHTEKLWRLTGSAWSYQPLNADLPIGPLPADRFGHFTFGCFHGIHKYRPPIISAWANILSRVPNSVLLLKSFKGLGQSETRQKFRTYFEEAHVDLNRLKFVPSSMSEEEHLQLFNQIDLCLDTFPYNGTTITCEALWMGVPSVTLAGPTHVSRVGASLMTHAGIPEAVTTNLEEYIDQAVGFAHQLERLRNLRQNLRSHLQSITLGNPDLYTRELEEVYSQMAQRRVA